MRDRRDGGAQEAPGGQEAGAGAAPLREPRRLSEEHTEPSVGPLCWECGVALDRVASDSDMLPELAALEEADVVLLMCPNMDCEGGAHLHAPKGKSPLALMVNTLLAQELLEALTRSVADLMEHLEAKREER